MPFFNEIKTMNYQMTQPYNKIIPFKKKPITIFSIFVDYMYS